MSRRRYRQHNGVSASSTANLGHVLYGTLRSTFRTRDCSGPGSRILSLGRDRGQFSGGSWSGRQEHLRSPNRAKRNVVVAHPRTAEPGTNQEEETVVQKADGVPLDGPGPSG